MTTKLAKSTRKLLDIIYKRFAILVYKFECRPLLNFLIEQGIFNKSLYELIYEKICKIQQADPDSVPERPDPTRLGPGSVDKGADMAPLHSPAKDVSLCNLKSSQSSKKKKNKNKINNSSLQSNGYTTELGLNFFSSSKPPILVPCAYLMHFDATMFDFQLSLHNSASSSRSSPIHSQIVKANSRETLQNDNSKLCISLFLSRFVRSNIVLKEQFRLVYMLRLFQERTSFSWHGGVDCQLVASKLCIC